MKLKVKSYSGHKANERPVSFLIDENEHFIEEIVESWVGEKFNFWTVRTDKNQKFLLKYDPSNDNWECEKIE